MNLSHLFKSQLLHASLAIPLANLFLCVLFLYAFIRHRGQFAFLIWSFGGFSATVVSTYVLCTHVQQTLGVDVLPVSVWRVLTYSSFLLGPAQFVAAVLGAVVLVWTYPKASRKRARA